MTREIKFRAWGTNNEYQNGKMIYLKDIDNNFLLNLNGDILVSKHVRDVDYSIVWGRIGWNNLELMQYTGLKDKNGVEIYEGDILRHEFEIEGELIDGKKEFEIYKNDEVGVCAYKEGMYGFISNDGKTESYPCRCEYDEGLEYTFEVIGNIHQNKDLLTQKQKS